MQLNIDIDHCGILDFVPILFSVQLLALKIALVLMYRTCLEYPGD